MPLPDRKRRTGPRLSSTAVALGLSTIVAVALWGAALHRFMQ